MKNIIILLPGPFSKRDYDRFGIELLKKNFLVHAIDCCAWTDPNFWELYSKEVFKCKVEYFKIAKAQSGEVGFMLQAGAFNGVRVGDQFLLSDNPAILNQGLSKEGLVGLALAEVERVNERTASLNQIAGPVLYDLSRYIALPF